jgi:aminomethyltransferase
VTTNDVAALALGQVHYSTILNDRGTIEDDCLVYRFPDRVMMVVNASNIAKDFAHIAKHAAKFGVTIEDVSDSMGLLALQGPLAAKILQPLTKTDLSAIKYYHFAEGEVAGMPMIISRTGYTGEDGFEIFVGNDDAAALWQALIAVAEDGELTPAGLASRDSLRLEAGMPLYGNELSLDGDPFAAGLGPVVALSKEGDFIGKAALAAKKEAGAGATTGRKLVGLKGLGRRAGRGHYPVLKDGNTVGEVTSGQPSPSLGYPVAMAYVDVEFTEPGTALDIDLRGKTEPFEVVALPFYKRQK